MEEGKFREGVQLDGFNSKKVFEAGGVKGARIVLPTASKTTAPRLLEFLKAGGVGDGVEPQISWVESFKDFEDPKQGFDWAVPSYDSLAVEYVQSLIRKEISRGIAPNRVFVLCHSQGGSVGSRGQRSLHRHLASSLGDFGAHASKRRKPSPGGDRGDEAQQAVAAALAFNDLKNRKKKLIFGKSAIHSWGLYAAEPIEKEDFVVEYMGEYIRNPVAEARQKRYERQGFDDDYIFRVDADLLVDATRRGGLARFANHCCDPNLLVQNVLAGHSDERLTRVGFVRSR